MQCPACGSENSDGALYCAMCKEVFRRIGAPPTPRSRPSIPRLSLLTPEKTPIDGLLRQAGSFMRLQRFAEAAPMYRRALEIEPGHARAWYQLGAALAGVGQPEEALKAWQRSFQLGPRPTGPLALKNGDRVGDYEIVKKLGEGGFGIVYLAYLEEARRHFALKTFRDQYLGDPEVRALFRAEAQTWVDLERHPFVVRARYVEEAGARLYVAMEYIEPDDSGVNSLEALLARRRPALAETLRWGIQISWGMEHANLRGIVAHRDLKPANILLDHGIARIADFGLASVTGRAGGTGGTPAFMPPEQWKDASSCDARSDIYSLGVLLYQLLSGRLPFLPAAEQDQKRWLSNLMRMHQEAPPPPIHTPAWPIVQRCLAKPPAQRYQSFAELRTELEALLLLQADEQVPPPSLEELELSASDWSHKGISLVVLGRLDEALACYDRALEQDPLFGAAWHNKANALQLLMRHDEAVKLYDGALGLSPDDALAMRGKAQSLFELGPREQALALFERALALDPDSPAAWHNHALLMERLGRSDDALASYQRALTLDPRWVESWINKANLLAQRGRSEEAATAFAKVAELDPSDARTFSNLGHQLNLIGRHEEALKACDRALEIDLHLTAALYNRGVSLQRLNRLDDAQAAYRKVLTMESDPRAQQATRARLAECLPPPPAEAVMLADRALALAKVGKTKEAIPLWERALTIAPDYARAWYDLGVARGRLGHLPESLACFGRILDDEHFGKSARENLERLRAKTSR